METITLERRQIGSGVIVLAGVAMLLSGLVVNPWVGRLTRGAAVVDHADVLRGYFMWSMALGGVAIALGRKVSRGKSVVDRLSVVFLLGAGLVLGDRWLLTKLGLTIWTHDSQLHHVQRPGAVRTLALVGRPNDLIRIDTWGFHDDQFPRDKPPEQLRGLMLGDAVTMGHGLTYAETFSKKLEDLLAQRDGAHTSHQIINAGVHGYGTYQERGMLERNLDLQPDFVAVGFCMNDVTEPFGVTQLPSPVGGWLASETGVGRLLQRLSQADESVQETRRRKLDDIREMTEQSRTSPKYQEAWQIALDELGALYSVAKEHELPVVLLVFPHAHQLNDPRTRVPQELLLEHAKEHGVDVIDLTPVLAAAVFQERGVLGALEREGKSPADTAKFFQWRIDELFLDQDRLREPGHALVAEQLYRWLERRGLVTPK